MSLLATEIQMEMVCRCSDDEQTTAVGLRKAGLQDDAVVALQLHKVRVDYITASAHA